MLVKAGQAEILRAAQRDQNFLSQFHELYTDILQSVLGIRTWIKYREVFSNASDLLYHSLTTLSNQQTLGEEYTGIFQTHSSGKSLQKKHVQLIMILLNSFGEKLLIDSLKAFEKALDTLPFDHPLRPEARETFVSISESLRYLIPYFQRFHKAIFYLNGDYYHFGKRITSTKYMLVRHWLKNRSEIPAFTLMGTVSLVHTILYILLTGIKPKGRSTRTERVAKNLKGTNQSCPLCLNLLTNTSLIPCGHLFCWDCIISCLQEQSHCPLCKKPVQPSRVIYLRNY